jgi:Asp/Glu/hydantoin racemase
MRKTLACIHTSLVFINVETLMNNLFTEIMPDIRRINIIDDSLLPDVMAKGEISQEVTTRMCNYVKMAEVGGANVILSLCSSLGPTIDQARKLVKVPVIKIDDPMADLAIESAKRIGILATVKTTLNPTLDLLQEKAKAKRKEVELFPCLVDGAFQILMSGDKPRHDAMVLQAALDLSKKVDILLCAQASMTRLVPNLESETGLTILSSPRLAIEYTKKVIDNL